MASNSLQVGASDYRNRTKAIGPFDGNNNNDGDMMDRLNICDTSSADARAGRLLAEDLTSLLLKGGDKGKPSGAGRGTSNRKSIAFGHDKTIRGAHQFASGTLQLYSI